MEIYVPSFIYLGDELMGQLVLKYKDWYLLNSQLMECVEEIRIVRRKFKNPHVWWATFFSSLFIS